MRYITFIGISLLLLVGCAEKEAEESVTDAEFADESTEVEKVIDTEIIEEIKEEEESKKIITEEEAKAISQELVSSFGKLMYELGEKHQWHFENPGVYEVAKPDLLAVATERFADETLKSYVEEYYCNCDSGWQPNLDERTIRVKVSDLTENSYIVKGINLPNYLNSGYELTMKFVLEEDGWKIDYWAATSIIGEKLNLTETEVSQGLDGEVIEEYLTPDGITAYKVKFSNEVIGVSKDNGERYYIE